MKPRLHVQELIGRGAFADVYRAVEDPSSRPVALKVLRRVTPEILSAFHQEVQLLIRLRHPGLVPLYGFSPDGRDVAGSAEEVSGRPCCWMELVEGRPFLDAASGRSPETVVQWLREMLEALDYVHGQGILHGDIKPSNLRIDSHGRPRLLDFGLSQMWAGAGVPKGFRGTLLYASPEAVSGRPNPASDVYSLGLVAHEALTGLHPHAGARSVHELFARPARRLADSETALPGAVRRALDAMIAVDPAERLATAADTLRALEDFAPPVKDPEAIPLHSLRLFGRDESMSRVLDRLRRMGEGGSLVLVHGPAGVGKSRFAREVSLELAFRGWDVDHRGDAERLPAAEISNLHRLMTSRGGRTATILEFTPERTGPSQAHFFKEIALNGRVVDVPLDPLSDPDASDFIRSVLRRDIPAEVLREILRRAGGLPDLIVRTLRQLVSLGLFRKRRLSLQDLKTSLPEDYENLFRQRLQALKERERRTLGFVVLARGPVSRGEVSGASGLAWTVTGTVLERLEEDGLVEPSNPGEGRVRAGDPALPALVREFLTPESAKSIHESWIAHWLSRKDASPDASVDLAFHALALPSHPQTAAWTLEAGEILRSRGPGSDEAMIPAYEACLRRNVGRAERDALFRALANACGRQGDFRKSLAWMEDWFSEFGESRGLSALKYWLASAVACKNLGDPGEARRRLLKGADCGDPDDPAQRPRLGRIHSLLGLMAAEDKNFEEARRHLEEARRLAPHGGPQEAEIFKHQAVLAFAEDRPDESLSLLGRSQEIYEAAGDIRGLVETEIERGNLAVLGGDLEAAETAYGHAARIAADAGREALLARACQNRGVLLCRSGRLSRALEELERARDLYVFFGDPPDKVLNLLQLALVHAWLGRFEATDRWVREARDLGADPELRALTELKLREREVFFEIETLRRGETPGTVANPFRFDKPPAPWDLEHRWLVAMTSGAGKDPEVLRAILVEVHRGLPPSLKPAFEERSDYRTFAQVPAGPPADTQAEEDAMAFQILDRIQAITCQLLNTDGLTQTLERILDAALELSRAQRGLLLLKGDGSGSPLPGFHIAAARNMSGNAPDRENLRASLSAVAEALRSGKPVVADNALEDERFRAAPSVVDLELKSVLAIPLAVDLEPVGALYLDHDFETEVFAGSVPRLLEVFAGQAALAIQKARLVDDLRRANAQLTDTVSDQSAEIVSLNKEVEFQRLQLKHEYAEIVGQSPKMLEVLRMVDRLIDTPIPVWIYGESGTGKEAVARALHFKGPRSRKPFVSENCSSLPETLLESELFGHKRGSFTHADRDKKGLLEAANGGTVFLDEVADMSAALQAKLLRFLQEGEIRPVGSNETVKLDVRVVCASNRDLNRLVREGSFREDLFYRLNGMTVTMPALRDRREDIPLLVQHFLRRQAAAEKSPPLEITRTALELLTDYDWPGNVRELENTLRSASLFHVHGKLPPKAFHFKKALFKTAAAPPATQRDKLLSLKKGSHETGFDEKSAILKALKDNRCHKGLAADALGISRRYLYTKLSQHGIPLKPAALRRFVEKETKTQSRRQVST